MRKENSIITGGLMPEKQETINKLSDIQRTKAQIDNIDQEVAAMNGMLRNTVKMKQDEGLDDDVEFDLMVEKILKYESIEALKAATKEDIDSILADSKGNNIEFHGATKMSDEEMNDLRRDYVEFVFNSEFEMKRLDEAREELNASWEAADEEFKEIFESIGGDVTKYITDMLVETRHSLETKAERTAEEEEQLEKIKIVTGKIDESILLTEILEYVTKFDVRNILNDYKHRSDDIGAKYAKATKKINLSVSLTAFKNVERLFLKDERYHEYGDLFTFIVMRYFSYKKNINGYDGVFLSQLAFELRQLYTKDPAKLTKDEEIRRTVLLTNIENILAVFYNKLG